MRPSLVLECAEYGQIPPIRVFYVLLQPRFDGLLHLFLHLYPWVYTVQRLQIRLDSLNRVLCVRHKVVLNADEMLRMFRRVWVLT